MWLSPLNHKLPVLRRALLLMLPLGVSSGCVSFVPYQNAIVTRQHYGYGANAYDANAATARPQYDRSQRDRRPKTEGLAAHPSMRSVVTAPDPFEWKASADSAGGRPIETMTLGHGGYRTLVIGNLAGNDPLAVRLTEQLAQYLHSNALVLGGIQTTIIRNANPDGLVTKSYRNENGVYLNREFPVRMQVDPSTDTARLDFADMEPEVRFIRSQIEEFQPQRIIHLRTYPGSKGVIASSSEAHDSAAEVAEWLSFEHRLLPGKSADGTLERFIATEGSRQIIAVAVPSSSTESELWSSYGDALLNLLMNDDYATRILARDLGDHSSADNRHRKPANSGMFDESSEGTFREDRSEPTVEDLPRLP